MQVTKYKTINVSTTYYYYIYYLLYDTIYSFITYFIKYKQNSLNPLLPLDNSRLVIYNSFIFINTVKDTIYI